MEKGLLALADRLRAAGIHLALCLVVAALVALVVFLCWYPAPFADLTHVAPIFLMLVGIDIVVGPALTLIVAKPSKPRAELLRDLSVIALLQLGALAYGLHSVASARPVALVFEVDLFRLVTANEIDVPALAEAPAPLRELSWRGPRLMAVVKPDDPDEQLRTIDLGLAGVPLAALPKYWRDYESHADEAWRKARPVALLLEKYPQVAADVQAAAEAAGQPAGALRFLPLLSRQASWVTVMAPGAKVLVHLPVDGFF